MPGVREQGLSSSSPAGLCLWTVALWLLCSSGRGGGCTGLEVCKDGPGAAFPLGSGLKHPVPVCPHLPPGPRGPDIRPCSCGASRAWLR